MGQQKEDRDCLSYGLLSDGMEEDPIFNEVSKLHALKDNEVL